MHFSALYKQMQRFDLRTMINSKFGVAKYYHQAIAAY